MSENDNAISSNALDSIQAGEPTDQKAAANTIRTYTEADVDAIRQQLADSQQEAIERAREEGRSEAEKLAGMSREQRVRYEAERREEELQARERKLAEREQEIVRRELRTEAVATLAARGIPANLAQILDYSSADACNASIQVVEKALREAVQAEVVARLSNNGPDARRDSGGTTERKTAGEELAARIGRQRGEERRQADDIINKYYLRRN